MCSHIEILACAAIMPSMASGPTYDRTESWYQAQRPQEVFHTRFVFMLAVCALSLGCPTVTVGQPGRCRPGVLEVLAGTFVDDLDLFLKIRKNPTNTHTHTTFLDLHSFFSLLYLFVRGRGHSWRACMLGSRVYPMPARTSRRLRGVAGWRSR